MEVSSTRPRYLYHSYLFTTNIKPVYSSLHPLPSLPSHMHYTVPLFSTFTSSDHSSHHSIRTSNPRLINFSSSAKITVSSACNNAETRCFLHFTSTSASFSFKTNELMHNAHVYGHKIIELRTQQSLH